jgi:hypothetical protein
MGISSLFFTLNFVFFHHPLIFVSIGQDIDLDMFYDNNMLNKYEWCKWAIINPKVKQFS